MTETRSHGLVARSASNGRLTGMAYKGTAEQRRAALRKGLDDAARARVAPRRIRNYTTPPKGLRVTHHLTPEIAAEVYTALPGATITPTSWGFRIEPRRTWRDWIRGWFR